MSTTLPARAALAVLIVALGVAGCERKAAEMPRETSENIAAREQARTGEGEVAEDYAAVGEATARVPEVGSPDASVPKPYEPDEPPPGAGADASTDYLAARRACEALENAAAQSQCLEQARRAYHEMTGRDPEAALPQSEQ